MKKLIVAVAVLGICISLPMAQANSLTLRPMIGYGIGTGKAAVGSDYAYDGTKTTKDENIYYSGGGGLKFGLGFDADIASNVALGLDVGYSMGFKTEIDLVTEPNYTEKTELKASYMPVSLTLKVKSKLEKVTVFAGMGPTVLLMPKAKMTYTETDHSDVFAAEADLTFKMGFGYHGLAGIEYAINDKMNFIAQLRADQVSVKTDKLEMTKATQNGTDVLAEIDVREKNITYMDDDSTDDYTKTTIANIDNAEIFPANSLAISIGIGYSF
jgi:opacity protein-like surface antigen